MSAGAVDRLRAEDIQERYDTLRNAIKGLAGRLEDALTEGSMDLQYLVEDALFNLDVLAGSTEPRGARADW